MPFAASLTGGSKMTLPESCIVAAIVSTLMAIATPSLVRAKETYALASAAHEVAAKMHATRITAIVRNQDCRITVTSATSYVTECQTTSWQTIERITLHGNITVTANARPEFHRRGNVSPTGTFTLSNASGRTVRVVVNVNGRVRIQ
jgi:Tfp pilus assembly protein FimT